MALLRYNNANSALGIPRHQFVSGADLGGMRYLRFSVNFLLSTCWR